MRFHKLHNNKGIALVISLLVSIVLIALSSIFVLRTVNESYTAKRQRDMLKTFGIAEGAAENGFDTLNTLINTDLLTTISATNPSTVVSQTQSYVASSNGLGFLVAYVKNAGVPQLTLNGAQAEYDVATTALGSGTYQTKIILTQKSNPVTVSSDIWDFLYYYRIEATGNVSGSSKKIVSSGDFTVRVRKDNFAKFALFTNQQTMQSGTNVWFTNKTNFAGPLHTNGRYNIAFNPSGVFDGAVTQKEQLARFYNNGSSILLDADYNGTKDVPIFNAGFTRNAPAITLTSPSQKTDMIAQATGGQSFATDGVYVPTSGSNLAGGIYVKGNGTVNLSVDGSNNPVYTVTQGATTKTVTVNLGTNQTTVQTGATTDTYNGKPYGVDGVGTIIYVDGQLSSLAGTVQKDTELTISTENDITITNHLRYQNYTAAVGTPGSAGYVPPNADDEKNILGLVSWSGNVFVGTSTPNNVDIHGTVLSQAGYLQVVNYNDTGVGPRGTATLLGGAITNYYGAFGLFSGSTGAQLSGYGRNFIYDNRMLTGSAPPYFPSLNTFIAFTNDITDKIAWQEGG